VVALRYIKLRREAGHAMPWLDQLPGRTTDILDADCGVLAFLEGMHGREVIRSLFYWLLLIPTGLSLNELQSMILKRRSDEITGCRSVFDLRLHLAASSKSLSGLMRDLKGWLVEQSSHNGIRQALYLISSPVIKFAVAKRYRLYQLDNPCRIDVAIEAEELCSTTFDTSTLRNYVHISSRFDAVKEKLKVISWLKAERSLASELDFNQLNGLVLACGRLKQSSSLEITLEAFDAIAKLPSEFDVEKMRELLSRYKIAARHDTVDESRRILRKVHRMRTERNFSELKVLYASTRRFVGSVTIEWVAKMLQTEKELADARTCSKLRSCVEICAGLLDCHNLNKAIEKLSAIEHIRLKSQVLKQDLDVLLPFMDKHSKAVVERLLVEEGKGKMKAKKMTWQVDSKKLVAAVNARSCESLVVDDAMMHMLDPGPLYMRWWDTFDEAVASLHTARSKAAMVLDSTFQFHVGEDVYSELQIQLPIVEHITDVEEIVSCLQAMQALRALDAGAVRSLMRINELMSLCGHIKCYKPIEQMRELLAAHDSLDSERDIRTLKKFLARCQWIEDSEVIERAKKNVGYITEIEVQYGLTSGGKKALPGPVLFDFVLRCHIYTGSEAVDMAIKLAQALAQLEVEGDPMTWTNLLATCAEQAQFRLCTQPNEWDVGQVSHLLGLCGHVIEEPVVVRSKQWYSGVSTLTQTCRPKISCGSRQLGILEKACGRLHGKLTINRVINNMIDDHNTALADALKDKFLKLPMYLRECNNPKSELKFPGWTDLMTMVDSCSRMANCAVPREDVVFFTQAIAMLRARNALDALEELQGSSWPRNVQRLRRQVADCEGIAQIPALETFRSTLSDIDTLAKTGHATVVMKVVQSTCELTGCPVLDKARAQCDALICLEQERCKDKIQALLATCEGLQGSDHLDRARNWILSEARLEGPLSAQEYGLVTLERNFVEMQRLVLACGDMKGSLALDAGREILAACARLATTVNAAELSSLVENIRSHNITCCAELDEAQIVLDEEAKLAEIVNIPDLILAVIHVEKFLHSSRSVQSANDRIMQALATSWRELLTNTSQVILTKLLHLGLDLVHSEMRSSVDSIDDCRQALSDLEVKLQAIDSLETEFRYPQTLDLLDIIGNIEGSTFLARARTWKHVVECLVNEDDASAIRHLVSQCQELSASEVLDKARRQVETLDTIEALPDLHAVDPQHDLHYHVTQLSHYCKVCQNVKGHQKLTAMHDGNNAVNEVEKFASLDTIERFPKYWHEVAGANIASTVNNVWAMVESLPKQSDMSILKTLLLTLDDLNTTQPMLDDLYSSRTSSVPRTPGFTFVSTEPWHVTISNQAHELKRIVDKTFFVAGNTRIVRARTVMNFFSVEDAEFCPEVQRMPELHLKLRSGEVGQQMIGMILATQAALKSGPYENITKAVAAEAKLLAEMRFPNIVKMLQACDHSMPFMWTESRARARKLIECEKILSEENHKRFNGSVYDDLQSAVRGMEGIRDCAPLDAARSKLKLIEDIEKNHDYIFIRDVVPHVDMIQGSTMVDHAKRALQAVREMISTKNVSRLRAIAAVLDRAPRMTGIPDFQRIKDLLALEAKLDDFSRDADVQMALWKIGDRLDGSATIIKARARLSKIHDMCETMHVHDLYSAASLGDIVLIKHYLEAGGTVHDKNSQGETALMHACTSGRIEAIEYLLASGGRLSDTAANGYNSLHYAVCAGHLSVVQLIVPKMKELRIPINAVVSALRSSPLHLAAKHGQSEIAYFLIENKASPEAGDANGNTALLCALGANKPDTAAFLIECGCNVIAQNADHYTALHLAAKHGHVHLAKDCMAAGLDPNLRTRAGLTALHLAAMESHLDMCFWLIHRPTVDVNVRDNRGFTPLHHAASAGQVELVKLLLSYGANPHLQNYVARGYHALDMAKDPEAIEVLSKYMTIPVTKTRLLHEAKLHAIVIYGCEELCDHRLRHGERKDAEQQRLRDERERTYENGPSE
jgi:ankyrin repeat protein